MCDPASEDPVVVTLDLLPYRRLTVSRPTVGSTAESRSAMRPMPVTLVLVDNVTKLRCYVAHRVRVRELRDVSPFASKGECSSFKAANQLNRFYSVFYLQEEM